MRTDPIDFFNSKILEKVITPNIKAGKLGPRNLVEISQTVEYQEAAYTAPFLHKSHQERGKTRWVVAAFAIATIAVAVLAILGISSFATGIIAGLLGLATIGALMRVRKADQFFQTHLNTILNPLYDLYHPQ